MNTIIDNANACMSEDFHRAAMDTHVTSEVAGTPVDERWTPYALGRRTPVVLVVDEPTASAVTIRRASHLADALEVKLHVVLGVRSKREHAESIESRVASLLEDHAPRNGYKLEITGRRLEDEGAQIARDAGAAIVVVGEGFGAAATCKLVEQVGVPVLVARDERPDGELIAASDMRHLRFPVLEIARDYGRALDRPVLFFHNAKPASDLVADPTAGAAAYIGMLRLEENAITAKRVRLRNVAHARDAATSVVARADSTVDAILELARQRDADLVVVGHRAHSWPWRLMRRRTTERVIERSRRSVLVVPVDHPA